jgi:hypothetical protein
MTLPVYRRRKVFEADLPSPAAFAHLRDVVQRVHEFPDDAEVMIEVLYDATNQAYIQIRITMEDTL